MQTITYVPIRPLNGRVPAAVPNRSIIKTIPQECLPLSVLCAETRTFSMEAAHVANRGEMTCETGGGSTNHDGKESSDGPFEDDEFGSDE